MNQLVCEFQGAAAKKQAKKKQTKQKNQTDTITEEKVKEKKKKAVEEEEEEEIPQLVPIATPRKKTKLQVCTVKSKVRTRRTDSVGRFGF